jgi:HB1, ASXL, restriction endonuclease HTH domain
MPDQYRFNHLGDDVRCIDCPSGGPLWQWPEHKRARATAKKGESAKQVAIDILRTAGQPLQASEIAKRVITSGRCAGLQGKTPEATISAMLAVGSKAGGPFARVDKGTYTLADSAPTANRAAEAKPATTAKRAATRKPAIAKSKTATKRPATKRTTAKRAR